MWFDHEQNRLHQKYGILEKSPSPEPYSAQQHGAKLNAKPGSSFYCKTAADSNSLISTVPQCHRKTKYSNQVRSLCDK
jgi:hypothetical protein